MSEKPPWALFLKVPMPITMKDRIINKMFFWIHKLVVERGWDQVLTDGKIVVRWNKHMFAIEKAVGKDNENNR